MNTNELMTCHETVATVLRNIRRRRLPLDVARKLIVEEVTRAYNHGVSVGLGSAMQKAQPKPRSITPAVYHRR